MNRWFWSRSSGTKYQVPTMWFGEEFTSAIEATVWTKSDLVAKNSEMARENREWERKSWSGFISEGGACVTNIFYSECERGTCGANLRVLGLDKIYVNRWILIEAFFFMVKIGGRFQNVTDPFSNRDKFVYLNHFLYSPSSFLKHPNKRKG